MSDDLIIAATKAVRLTQYFTLASLTVYLYDLLLTLDLEINLLWPSKWTLMKVLYLVQRYLPLIDMGIVVMSWQFGEITNLPLCEVLFRGCGWSILVGMTLSEVILMRRTLAVWGNGTKLRITLFLFLFFCLTPVYFLLERFHETLTYHSIPIPGLHCFATGQSHISSLCWAFLTVYDTVLLMLTAIPAFRTYRSGGHQSSLFQVVYRDGVLYYLYLVALSGLNVLWILKLPGGYATLLTSVERVAYSVLTSHVVLHIREQTYQRQVVMNSHNPIHINVEVDFRRSEI
ncbi:hypothetical protein BDN72DRAFT_323248 [Pluteus cervinus]|uniref:Uncharacterized protein n=1 Tax=Pluteus cervinus TaxID=181527 RepID=A0ACD3ACR0_9AGAR|nr:hypothetical protein BDN72DRAFT_323248 [Pluteus cervinus]